MRKTAAEFVSLGVEEDAFGTSLMSVSFVSV